MPETDKIDGSKTGEPESSSSGLWKSIRALFPGQAETSLREQLAEAIDEHEDEAARTKDKPRIANNDLSPVELVMLKNLLKFSDHDADDVAVPRGEIIAIDAAATWEELIASFAENSHSRLPVFRESLDDVIGMVHMKDVFPYLANGKKPPEKWTELMREPLYVPQSRGALDVLADMRARRMHLAIVVDEFSGTDGLITIEDLVEEIVGEIEDEHDDAPVELVVEISEGVWDADARAELEDVAEIVGDKRLAEVEEAVDTLGGLAFVLAEKFPLPGTILDHPSGWKIEITQGDETHVTRLRLFRPITEEAEQLIA